ncbi:MAG: hypothetical protein ACK4OO_08050, partial [bacterium]
MGCVRVLVGAFILTWVGGADSSQNPLSVIPPKVPQSIGSLSHYQVNSVRDENIYKICALRVEFIPDTLSTTTGDGTFAYDRNSPLYSSFSPDEQID